MLYSTDIRHHMKHRQKGKTPGHGVARAVERFQHGPTTNQTEHVHGSLLRTLFCYQICQIVVQRKPLADRRLGSACRDPARRCAKTGHDCDRQEKVLAKHDENYMPPEISDIINKGDDS